MPLNQAMPIPCGEEVPCGEGLYPRWAAQQPPKKLNAIYTAQRDGWVQGEGRETSSPQSLLGAGLLAKAAAQLASILNVPPSSRASPLPHRMLVNTVSATAPNPGGSEPARDEIDTVPDQTKSPASPINPVPTAPTYTPPPTHESLRLCLQLRQNPPACAPCPLGSIVVPATAHQWSGLVARFTSRLHKSHRQALAYSRWWLCAWRLRARRVWCDHRSTNLRTAASIRLVAKWCGPIRGSHQCSK
ncbi:hypothetical protein SAMN03159352_05132 [Pseudomonas sp. NFACC43]|nr:hypothetical protein SAMN03159442_04990 [Pseudomonas sp. NFACC47-1]SFY42269.1 hypothetical protein SAMN03159352_05132 [Pseudomonas sp. NFACC43]